MSDPRILMLGNGNGPIWPETSASAVVMENGESVQDALNAMTGPSDIVFSETAPSTPTEGMIWLKPVT